MAFEVFLPFFFSPPPPQILSISSWFPLCFIWSVYSLFVQAPFVSKVVGVFFPVPSKSDPTSFSQSCIAVFSFLSPFGPQHGRRISETVTLNILFCMIQLNNTNFYCRTSLSPMPLLVWKGKEVKCSTLHTVLLICMLYVVRRLQKCACRLLQFFSFAEQILVKKFASAQNN